MVMQDITRLREIESQSILTRQRLEQELSLRKRLEESLRRSEAMYRAMFEHTGTAMLVIDEDRTIAMANREVEKITGYKREDIVGKRKWHEFVHPEDIQWMSRYHVERRKENSNVPNHYEFRLLDARGNIKDIFYTIGMIPAGLYNRAYFEEEMQRLEKGRHFPVSIICGDVDGLKTVNDTMGHKKGDELLLAAAGTIKRCTRAGDVVARVGGDEFVVILTGTGAADTENVVQSHPPQHPAVQRRTPSPAPGHITGLGHG